MILIIAVPVCFTAIGFQSDAPSEGQRITAAVFASLISGREELRSGIFKARGRVRKEAPVGWDDLEGDVEIFCAFDNNAGLLRFDRTEPAGRRVPSVPPIEANQSTAKSGSTPNVSPNLPNKNPRPQKYDNYLIQKKSTYIRNLDSIVAWEAPWKPKDSGAVQTDVGIYPLDHDVSFIARPFDIHGLGLYFWSGFFHGTNFDKLQEALSPTQWNLENNDQKQIYHFTRNLRRGEIQHLWVDKSRGFSPIRNLVVRRANGTDNEILSSQVDYKFLSGVWVPSSYQIEEKGHPRTSGNVVDRSNYEVVNSYDLSFEWSSVNQSIDSKLFDPEFLDVPVNTALNDYRLSKPVLLKLLNSNLSPPPSQPPVVGRKFNSILFAISINIALLVLVVACLLIRRSLRSRRRDRV